MSHITSVETEIYDRGVLLQALEKLGLSWVENQWVSYHHDGMQMELAIPTGSGAGLGFHRDRSDEPYELHTWGSIRPGIRKSKEKILQEYARIKVLKEARARNYGLVRQEVLSGNRIRLVFRKVA